MLENCRKFKIHHTLLLMYSNIGLEFIIATSLWWLFSTPTTGRSRLLRFSSSLTEIRVIISESLRGHFPTRPSRFTRWGHSQVATRYLSISFSLSLSLSLSECERLSSCLRIRRVLLRDEEKCLACKYSNLDVSTPITNMIYLLTSSCVTSAFLNFLDFFSPRLKSPRYFF